MIVALSTGETVALAALVGGAVGSAMGALIGHKKHKTKEYAAVAGGVGIVIGIGAALATSSLGAALGTTAAGAVEGATILPLVLAKRVESQSGTSPPQSGS